MQQITKYLYDHTELFEEKYENEYNHELYKFFSGKCNRYSKDHNTLMELMTPKQKKEMYYEKLFL